MDNPNADTTEARRETRKHRERAVEEAIGRTLEGVAQVAMLFFRTLEGINERIEHVQEQTQELEDTLNAIESEESQIVAGVKLAGERFPELLKALEGLPKEGGTVSPDEVAALNTHAQSILSGVTTAANALTAEIPGVEMETGKPVEEAKPNKALYLRANEADLGDVWTLSAFQVPAVPANPTTGAAEEPAKPLYEFSGDAVDTTEANGAVENAWVVYSGPTEPVPTA